MAGEHVSAALKGIIGAPLPQILETGLKLLAITTLIEFPGGLGQFFSGNIPALFGGELESSPVRLGLCAIVALVEMVKPCGVPMNSAPPTRSLKAGRSTSVQQAGCMEAYSSRTTKSSPSPRSESY